MNLNDDLFKKIKKRTNVDKDTILGLADKLQKGNMKDEKTIKEIIGVLSSATGKKVSEEQTNKIINKITKNEVPKSIDKMF